MSSDYDDDQVPPYEPQLTREQALSLTPIFFQMEILSGKRERPTFASFEHAKTEVAAGKLNHLVQPGWLYQVHFLNEKMGFKARTPIKVFFHHFAKFFTQQDVLNTDFTNGRYLAWCHGAGAQLIALPSDST